MHYDRTFSLRVITTLAFSLNFPFGGGDEYFIKGSEVRQMNFRIHMTDKRYFVDKSYFIKEVMEDRSIVTSIARPRKFGKSLILSMLYYFLTKNGRFSYLYENLTISREARFCRHHQNRHPTLIVSFGYNTWTTYEGALDGMRSVMSKLYRRNSYVMKSPKVTAKERYRFDCIVNKSARHAETVDAISYLLELLHRFHNRTIVLLVDEYDTPINRAFFKGFYPQMVQLMRSVLQKPLERNPYLRKAVLMGTTQISYQGLFLGINFVETNSARSLKYARYFGFAEDEVERMLEAHNRSTSMVKKMEQYYAGYYMGNIKMFNPLSIAHFLKRKGSFALSHFWVKTADPSDFRELMLNHGVVPIVSSEILLRGDDIYKQLKLSIELPALDTDETTFWTYLSQAGYLAFSTKASFSLGHSLRLPNREVALAFNSAIKSYLKVHNNTPPYETFVGSLRDKNSTAIKYCLEHYVNNSGPFFKEHTLPALEELFTGILRGVERDYGSLTKKREDEHTSVISLGPSNHTTDQLVFVLSEVRVKEDAKAPDKGVKQMWVKFCRLFSGNETTVALSLCNGLFELKLSIK